MDTVKFLLMGLAFFAGSSIASSIESSSPVLHHWSLTGSIGVTTYQNMVDSDGTTVLGRLAFGKELDSNALFALGLELGVQNGNSMRVAVPEGTSCAFVLGDLPIQSIVKPMLDFLVTAKINPLDSTPFFAALKGGVAYRHWQFEDRDSISALSQIAGEVQAGFGVLISDKVSFAVLYQGVFGGNPDLRIDEVRQTATVATIPLQNGVLLSMALSI